MLPQVDTLPGSQRERSTHDRYAQVNGGQCCSHVGRHIVSALRGVLKNPVAVWDKPAKEALKIGPNVGIRVFLDQQGGRRVLEPRRKETRLETGLPDESDEFTRELGETPSTGFDAELVRELAKHASEPLVDRGAADSGSRRRCRSWSRDGRFTAEDSFKRGVRGLA